jgi:hypothetical protein
VSIDYICNVFSSTLSEQGDIPLSSSTLPLSPRMVSFDWNDLVELHLHSSTPFQIRVKSNSKGTFQCIIDEGAYESILSSLTWKDFGSTKIVSATSELLDFDTRPSEYLGIILHFHIMLCENIFLDDVLVVKGPLDFNMLLRHDYLYLMNTMASILFRVIDVPHNKSIFTIDHLTSDNHHHNLNLS